PSATGATYTPTNADVGLQLRAVLTFTDGGGNAESITSAATGAVINVNQPPTGAAVLSDTTPTEGSAVTAATATIADPDGLGAWSFQWQRSAVAGGAPSHHNTAQ